MPLSRNTDSWRVCLDRPDAIAQYMRQVARKGDKMPKGNKCSRKK